MQLRANTIEFVFDVNCSWRCSCRRLWRQVFRFCPESFRGSYIDDPFPDRFGCWFGAREHAFDWAKERKLRPVKLVISCQNRGASDVAQEHVRFLHLIERCIERLGDCFLNQAFA